MTDASAALTADGRRMRPERNRLAVVDAILQLLDEGHVDPAAALVAERAGVSVRSVFRYFEDLDSLAMAAVERQIERVGHLYEPPDPDGSLTERVEALLVQRCRLFEAVAPVRRHALRRAHAQPAMRAGLEQSGDVLRHQIGVQFAAELDGLAPAERSIVLDALESGAGWSTWEHLRTDLDRSTDGAVDVIRHIVLAVLSRATVAP